MSTVLSFKHKIMNSVRFNLSRNLTANFFPRDCWCWVSSNVARKWYSLVLVCCVIRTWNNLRDANRGWWIRNKKNFLVQKKKRQTHVKYWVIMFKTSFVLNWILVTYTNIPPVTYFRCSLCSFLLGMRDTEFAGHYPDMFPLGIPRMARFHC